MRTVAIRRCGVAALFIAFLLVIVAPAVSAAQEVSFDGSGWGDGVGLSQYGAKAMASDGADYLQ
jgi:SpoIID/LytB domain protein